MCNISGVEYIYLRVSRRSSRVSTALASREMRPSGEKNGDPAHRSPSSEREDHWALPESGVQ